MTSVLLAGTLASGLMSCAARLNAPIPLETPTELLTESGMSLSPTTKTVSINGSVSYSVSGGTAPYTYNVYYGGGVITPSGVYTAPAAPGDAVVRVTDAQGKAAYAGLLVTDDPIITPATLTVAAGNRYSFSSASGTAPYTFEVVSGSGSINAQSGLYTAGSAGAATIRVSDAKWRSSAASVTVENALTISPKVVSVGTTDRFTFTTSGGVGTVTYSIVSGEGRIDPASGEYLAPSSVGLAMIKAEDRLGNFDSAIVTLIQPLRISPASLTLAKGSPFTFSAMGGKPPYTFAVTSGGGSFLAPGVYTAPSAAGTSTVTVTDAESQTATCTVTVTESLSFSIPSITLMVGDTHTFSAAGGVPPYAFTVPSGAFSLVSGTEYRADIVGTHSVQVMDSQSPTANSATAIVVVNPTLTISPAVTALAVGNSLGFSPAGGVPPYTFFATAGSINVSTGAFTAPAATGPITVTVTDSQAHTATATVTVNPALSILPAAPTLAPSAGQTFTAAGGVPPYTFSLLSGLGSINSETGAYTAYPSPGLATIRVRDGLGNTADAAVTIVEPLSLSPGTISLLKGSGIVFSARGGLDPYSYAVKTGQGSINNSTGAYIAPSVAGTATIEVTDSLGTKAESAVTIYDGLTILPFTKTLVVNQVFSFSAAGGVAPYTYSVVTGGGSITASSGAYTAPAAPGSATVRVTDASGNTSEATVTIQAALTISPTTKSLVVNNAATFAGSDGIPPYTFSIAAGGGSISATTGEYTAPVANGSATIRVTDSAGSFAEALVTIESAIAISPLMPFVGASGSQTFSSAGGVGAKTYSLRSGPGSINATSGSYSAPGTPGSAVVRVTDSLGNFAETTVTTYAPLALTPAAAAIAVGNSVSFTATGGVLPYVLAISSGGGTLSASGIYTAPGASGSATVRITDALGTPVEAPITISNALSISPASKTLLVNGTHTFTASGGVAPYSYSVIEGGGTINGSGLYTAPGTPGSAFVRVTDNLGNTSDASVTINPALTLSPSTVTLAVNNTATFTASGGIGSYTYSVASGAGTGAINETSGLYTAPASIPAGNSATVRVTDSESHTAEATVTINAALSISPTTPTVAAGGTQTFTSSGGVPGYTFSKPTGSGSMGGAVYTAPSVNTGATATVRVTDSKDNSAETTITVPAISVSITSPSGGTTVNVANQAALTVSGACSEATRTVTVSAGAVTASPTCSGGNTWSTTLDLSSLSDGAISITANHSNVNSVAAAEASVSVNKDGTAPTSIAITTPTASAYVNAANTSAFTISGTCSEPGTDNVTVKAGATTLGTASCSGTTFSGSFDLSAQAEGAVSLT
ncbi:MAG: hypothetical protein NDJ90_09705, partial [Oligoflexia bacterium]|nr:hypothetical protein [Oligoflexia bacterium]